MTRELSDYLSELKERPATGPADRIGTGGLFAYRLDGRIEHLLLDEFQDTAPVQWRVLQPLAEHVTRGSGRASFFCVGDAKQAIYGWRGGVAELFEAVQSQLPGLQQQQLNTSYRSAPPIIDTVNQVFQSLDKHSNLDRAAPAVLAWKRHFPHHSTERNELPGLVVLETTAANRGRSAADSMDFAADQVSAIARRSPSHSIGILVRTNQTVGRLIAALKKRGTAASEEGGNPLTDSRPVQLVLSLIRLADHPADGVSRFHLAQSPLGAAFGLDGHTDPASFRLARNIRRQLGEDGYGAAVASWAGLLREHCSFPERARLEQLVELAYSYQPRATLRCRDFIRFVERQRVADPASTGVRVMTVHQAKGLEFDIVVLPELDVPLTAQPDPFVAGRSDPAGGVESLCRYVNQHIQQLLPPRFQEMFETATQRAVTESLCVFYVAMTRAVHELRMLINPSAPSEKVLPRTVAGLLRAALSDGQPVAAHQTLYEHGDREWYTRLGRGVEPPPVLAERITERPRPLFLPLNRGRRRGLQRTAPSTSEGGSHVRLRQVMRVDSKPALLRGSVMHAWCEAIEWLEDGPPEAGVLRQAAQAALREANLPTADVDSWLLEFYELLQQPEIDRVFRRSTYVDPHASGATGGSRASVRRVEADRELPFAIRRDDELVSGRIDRLVRIYDGSCLAAAEILDFKSDAIGRDDEAALTERLEFYRPQLAAYRQAVADLLRLAPQDIGARLVFLQPGRVLPV